jgi:hypothetical protein
MSIMRCVNLMIRYVVVLAVYDRFAFWGLLLIWIDVMVHLPFNCFVSLTQGRVVAQCSDFMLPFVGGYSGKSTSQ